MSLYLAQHVIFTASLLPHAIKVTPHQPSPRPARLCRTDSLPVWQAATPGTPRFRLGSLPDGPHRDPDVPYIPCRGAKTRLAVLSLPPGSMAASGWRGGGEGSQVWVSGDTWEFKVTGMSNGGQVYVRVYVCVVFYRYLSTAADTHIRREREREREREQTEESKGTCVKEHYHNSYVRLGSSSIKSVTEGGQRQPLQQKTPLPLHPPPNP